MYSVGDAFVADASFVAMAFFDGFGLGLGLRVRVKG